MTRRLFNAGSQSLSRGSKLPRQVEGVGSINQFEERPEPTASIVRIDGDYPIEWRIFGGGIRFSRNEFCKKVTCFVEILLLDKLLRETFILLTCLKQWLFALKLNPCALIKQRHVWTRNVHFPFSAFFVPSGHIYKHNKFGSFHHAYFLFINWLLWKARRSDWLFFPLLETQSCVTVLKIAKAFSQLRWCDYF